ncbi:hypothetical protein KASHIRA_01730 [Serratia phage vB_SmaM-Kashira]|nr:hypothetical protein KASHIRA_01730 [Serratia phage vB_SmaM-Kashira]
MLYDSLFLIFLAAVVSAPFVHWWVKTPKNGWIVSKKVMGHCFTNGTTVSPGHPFKAPVLKKAKK